MPAGAVRFTSEALIWDVARVSRLIVSGEADSSESEYPRFRQCGDTQGPIRVEDLACVKYGDVPKYGFPPLRPYFLHAGVDVIFKAWEALI